MIPPEFQNSLLTTSCTSAPPTTIALSIFNVCILREAITNGLLVIDLRLICTEPEDYANEIESGVGGGRKIAAAHFALGPTPRFLWQADRYIPPAKTITSTQPNTAEPTKQAMNPRAVEIMREALEKITSITSPPTTQWKNTTRKNSWRNSTSPSSLRGKLWIALLCQGRCETEA